MSSNEKKDPIEAYIRRVNKLEALIDWNIDYSKQVAKLEQRNIELRKDNDALKACALPLFNALWGTNEVVAQPVDYIDELRERIAELERHHDAVSELATKRTGQLKERDKHIRELEACALIFKHAMTTDINGKYRLVMRHGNEPDLDREPTPQELADALGARICDEN